MTDGAKTTEFMLTALLLAASVLYVALGDSETAKAAFGVAVGLATGGYAIARGIAKRGP